MIRLRRLAIVLMAVGLITSAIYATGAFTNITAQRDANIHVAGDSGSYLSLQPANGSNGAYATQRSGQLRVSLTGAFGGESSGAGVNRDSLTAIRDVFTITNKGTQPLGVWVTDSSEAVTFEGGKEERTLEGKQQAMSLKPGDSVTVGLTVDTRQHQGDSVIKSVQIHADSDVSGAAVGSRSGNSATKPAADHPATGQSTPSSPPSTPKQKQKDGGGPLNWVNDKVVKPVTNTVSGALNIGGDFFNGIASWSREKLMKKFSYVTNQPIDALKSLGETAWNTLMGFFVGGYGMPGGLLGFEAREAHSPFYLIGSMLSVFNPLTDTLAGIRDLSANLLKGVALGVAIEAVGLLPVGGLGEDAQDIINITKTWVKSFPNKAAKALQPVSNLILDPISKMSPKAKGVIQTIKEKFPGAAKRGDDAGTGATKGSGMSFSNDIDEDVIRKLEKSPGYSDTRMRRLVNKEKFHPNDLKKLADENVDLQLVEKLSKSGASPDGIVHLAKHGEETYPKLTLEDAEELKNAGYKGDDIVSISKNAESKYPARVKGTKKPSSGVTKAQLLELRKQDDIPAKDVRHYVENSYSLKLVSFLSKQGHSSGRIRKFFLGSPGKIKSRMKQGRFIRDEGSTGAAIAKDTYGWCGMKEKRGKTVKTCKRLP